VRRGFTLIELMVVVIVISILMALLLPAINSVRMKAKEASVVVEIKQLESAIATFKAKYGIEPPSRISIYLTQAGWNTDAASMATIRRIWPQFDFTMSGGAGTAYPSHWTTIATTVGSNQVINLNSGECLLFFLGGVITTANNPAQQVGSLAVSPPIGFAKNPQYPFGPTTSNREGPFFEFNDISRVMDVDGNGINEWYDPLPPVTTPKLPYLYFSSYDGSGYRIAELPGASSGAYSYLHDVYRVSGAAGTNPPATPGASAAGSQQLPAQRPQSFQIISPGYDGSFGSGGVFNSKLPNAGLTDSSGKADTAGYDNLTNFNAGRLNP
jgi:general secretion pathway protein G